MITTTFIVLALLGAAFLLFKAIILPLYRISFYTKQGLKQKFFVPFLGLLFQMIQDMNGKQKDAMYTLKHLSQNFKDQNQDAFISNLGSSPVVYLLDATLIGEFLQKQTDYYEKSEIATKMSKLLFGKGIVFAEGEEWKFKRKLLSNTFHFNLIKDQVKLVLNVTKRVFEQEDQNAVCFLQTAEKIGGEVGLMSFLGVDINNYTLFGKDINSGINQYVNEMMPYMKNIFTILMGEYLLTKQVRNSDKKIMQGSQEIKNLLKKIVLDEIEKTKSELKQNINNQELQISIISIMLKDGQLQTDEEVDELVILTLNFYFAAKDTVSRLFANLMYYIGKNDFVYDKLEKEILSFQDEEITIENMRKYTYLEAVIKESLRICGPSPFLIQRTALQDHNLVTQDQQKGKYKIKKGTGVNSIFIYNFFNEKYFNNPFEFNPDRWLDPVQLEKIKINPFSYLPFSGGSRNCIGQYFAMMEIKALLIYFMRTYEKYQIPENFQYHLIIKTTIETKDHLTCSLKKRVK